MVGRLGPELSTVRAFPLGGTGATGMDDFLDDDRLADDGVVDFASR